eukprot:gene18179-19993_t
MAHLSSGKVNLALVREAARRELLSCLDRCPGSKAIVWDEKLTGPVGLVAEYSLLKEHEVGKMVPLSSGKLPPCDEHNIIFLVRPKLELMHVIAENISKEESRGSNKDYHIFFVPRKSLLCESRLQELGVYGTFTNIEQYSLDLIPFDHDLMSLEHELSFTECNLEKDLSSMYFVANSLMKLQALFGVIPKVFGKGDMALHVTDMIIRKRRELADVETQITPVIDNLLLIDRSIDLITPLLTQLTYEGLIDEVFGIVNTNVQLPADKFPVKDNPKGSAKAIPAKDQQKPRKTVLNSADTLYTEIRDINFSAVGPVLSREAKRITAQYEEHKSAKTVGEIKEFVHKLPHIQAAKTSLELHTSIAEIIKEKTNLEDFREALITEQEFFNGIDSDKINAYIDKCIASKQPLTKVLRLVCLQCLVNNGFKAKLFDYYRREIIHAYGFEHSLTLHNLEQLGMLKPAGQRTYTTLKKSLGLVVEDVHEQNPTDIAYVHSGYAPLSIRLAQFMSRQTSWHGLEEVLKQLPGPTVDEIQFVPPSLLKKSSAATASGAGGDGPSKVTLAYFLGGCTYSEVAALRFLAQQENSPTDYIIATTKLINGNTLLESLFEKIEKAEDMRN